MTAGILRFYRFIFARKNLYWFNLHLYKLALRGLGVLNSEGSSATGETYFFRWLRQQEFTPKVVFDVGANTGTYSTELLEFFPEAELHCFEPNLHTFLLLARRFRQRSLLGHEVSYQASKKPTLLPVAVSNKMGEGALWDFADHAPLKHTQPSSTLASLHRGVITKLHHQPPQASRVICFTLDQYAVAHQINQIDLLKIDTEGHERAVLEGAKELIAQDLIRVVQLEFNEMNAFSGVFMRDICDLLPRHRWYRLLPQGLLPLGEYRPLTHEIFGFQNLVGVLETT